MYSVDSGDSDVPPAGIWATHRLDANTDGAKNKEVASWIADTSASTTVVATSYADGGHDSPQATRRSPQVCSEC